MSHECFSDEIAIDFPSVGRVVERMRDAFLGQPVDADVLRADVSLSQREAFAGSVVSVNVPVRVTVPPRVADGARFRFRITSPDASSVRVEVRVAIRSSAA